MGFIVKTITTVYTLFTVEKVKVIIVHMVFIEKNRHTGIPKKPVNAYRIPVGEFHIPVYTLSSLVLCIITH